MIIYCSMFAYVFIVGWLGKTYIISNDKKTKYNNNTTLLLAIVIFLIPVFFIGMRTNYIDTSGYIAEFNGMDISWSNFYDKDTKGIGWHIYVWIIKRFISKDFQVYLMITAIIQAGAVLKLYYKNSVDYPYSVLLFFLSCSFVYMMNGIRQFMAVCIILYFSDLLFKKRILRFVIVILIACTFHISALIWLIAAVLVLGKPGNYKTFIYIFLVLLSIFFVDRFTDLLSLLTEDTNYAGYISSFANDDGSNIAHTIIAFVPIVVFYTGKKEIVEQNDQRINIMINISIIGAMLSLLAHFTSGILMGRMPIYFTVFNFALLPELFEKTHGGKYNKLLRSFCVLGYICFAFYYMTHAWGSAGMPYISDTLGINVRKLF